MKQNHIFIIAIMGSALFLSGCATTFRTSPTYESSIKEIKTIAIMPPDVEVYKLTAGGVRELIDEWSTAAKKYFEDALVKYLGQRHDFQVKFISEDWLKDNYGDLWRQNRALYNAISLSALRHAYADASSAQMSEPFPTKMEKFDYSMGKEIQDLARAVDADALLFLYGYDHEATTGRDLLLAWNITMAVFTGVMIIPTNPSAMTMGLINAKTGDLEWFNRTPPDMEYSFRSQKHIGAITEWLTRNFVMKK
jgi:hypothetical protein